MPDEENNIVFTVKDSAGRTGVFAVANIPYYDEGFGSPDYSEDDIVPSSRNPHSFFVKNRLIATAHDGVTAAQVQDAVSSLGGEIIGQTNVIDRYYLYFPEETEAGLLALADRLEGDYPDVFMGVYLCTGVYYGSGMYLPFENNLFATAHTGVTFAQVENAVSPLSGIIIAVDVGTSDTYSIYFPEKTRAKRLALANRLMAEHPDVFSLVVLNTGGYDYALFGQPSKAPWWSSEIFFLACVVVGVGVVLLIFLKLRARAKKAR